MRKQDYSILAEAIRKHGFTNTAVPYHYETEEQKKGARTCAERIAGTFAHFAHVKKDDFLKACGIE